MDVEIKALKVAELDTIRPMVVNFQGFSKEQDQIRVKEDKLYNYAFLVKKDGKNILVDNGLKDVLIMNKPTLEIFKGAMRWKVEQQDNILERLKNEGIGPEDIDYVILTHFHYDHCSNTDLFPNAKIIFHKKAWINVICSEFPLGPFYPKDILAYIVKEWDRVMVLEDDQDILNGISLHWLGGHDHGCTAVVIKTHEGKVILTSDAIQVYENLEEPVGVNYNLDECYRAMTWVKENGEIIIPSHDPKILIKYTDGKII
jgi:glyoxylase-like metal-dependent hydrolase (beta-lactamase superfamily II)